MPFELKSIYGLQQSIENEEEGVVEGDQNIVKENEEAECLVCLTEIKDTLIMPCCHLCICGECGKNLVKAKHTCPICRGNIASLIPMKNA